MKRNAIDFSPPLIGEEEIRLVLEVLKSGWLSRGPMVGRLEESFRQRVEAPAALAVSSCTAAMELALTALGVGPGHLVVTTPMTFCSTVHAIERVGARPYLVDVDQRTLNLDIERVADIVRRQSDGSAPGRIDAVLPVHLWGHPCEIDPLIALAKKYDLAIVEDAAHAFPAWCGNRPVGAVLDGGIRSLACFSFYATKNMTTGEGGMVTGSAPLVAEAEKWHMHGFDRAAWRRYNESGSWWYDVARPGFKHNMSDILAAIGLAQVDRIESLQRQRLCVVRRYQDGLASREELELPVELAGVTHSWHIFAIRLRLDHLKINRSRFIEELKKRRIAAGVHFIPVHLFSYYREKYGFKPDDYPIAHQEYTRLVSLPLHPGLTTEDAEAVVGAVCEVLDAHRR